MVLTTEFNKCVQNIASVSKKAVRIEQQFLYLQDSVTQLTIPKGIREQCNFKCSINDENLQTLFNNMSYFSASRILDTLIIYYRNWKNNLWSKHYQLLQNHTSTMDTMDKDNLRNVVNSIIRKEKASSIKTRESKLKRDKEFGLFYISVVTKSTTDNQVDCLKKRSKCRKKKNRPKRKRSRLISCKFKRKSIKCTLTPKEDIPMEVLQKSVINLTDKELTRDQLYVFNLGESFAPTPKLPNIMQFNDDIRKWTNSLRRAAHYELTVKELQSQVINTAEPNTPKSPLQADIASMERAIISSQRNDNGTEVKESKFPALELFISKVKQDLLKHKNVHKKNNPSNIDKATQNAVNEMKNWDNVVIRMFDKGSGFFLMSREEYIQRVMSELSDTSTYEVIPDQKHAMNQCYEAIKGWITKYLDEPGMTERLKKWVTPTGKEQPGNNYLNFKAHKPEDNFPGRLISTGCNTPTRNISELTAFELKKVNLSYNISGTDDFLRKIDQLNKSKKLVGNKLLFCSFDIVAMFPSISKDLGLKSCKKHLDKRKNKIFSTDCILDAIEITLDNNLTTFNGHTYRQKRGAAMGGANSCDYADVALADLDKMIHEGDLFVSHGIKQPLLFLRYRDDIIVIYLDNDGKGLEEIIKLFNFCNKYHPDIKFTMTKPSNIGSVMLNTYLFFKNNLLHTRPHSKECDTHCYLMPNSSHPLHTVRNIPYGIAQTVFKISSDPESYTHAKLEYSEYLSKRGYSEDSINESFEKVEKLVRNDLIYKSNKPHKKSDVRNFPLVCDFNPALPPVGKIINNYKYLLKLDEELAKVINPEKVFVSYRGNKTFKDLLVPSKLKIIAENKVAPIMEDQPIVGCFKCKANCKLCREFLEETNQIWSYHTNQEFPFKVALNCKSENIIYKIDCLICKRSSCGSTCNGMSLRWPAHKTHIRTHVKSCEVAHHFSTEHKLPGKKSDMTVFDNELKKLLRVTIIDQVQMSENDSDEARLRKLKTCEAYWQNQLKTLTVYGGLNKRDARKETSARSYSKKS